MWWCASKSVLCTGYFQLIVQTKSCSIDRIIAPGHSFTWTQSSISTLLTRELETNSLSLFPRLGLSCANLKGAGSKGWSRERRLLIWEVQPGFLSIHNKYSVFHVYIGSHYVSEELDKTIQTLFFIFCKQSDISKLAVIHHSFLLNAPTIYSQLVGAWLSRILATAIFKTMTVDTWREECHGLWPIISSESLFGLN